MIGRACIIIGVVKGSCLLPVGFFCDAPGPTCHHHAMVCQVVAHLQGVKSQILRNWDPKYLRSTPSHGSQVVNGSFISFHTKLPEQTITN